MHENERDWRLPANTQYHEAMKIVVNLATASLVLPTVLIEKIYPAHSLDKWAYRSWALLFFSIFLCMLFFYASAKYVKVVSGGSETPPWPLGSVYDRFHKPRGKSTDRTSDEEQKRSTSVYEAIRDGAIFFSILSFMAGLVCMGRFALDLK